MNRFIPVTSDETFRLAGRSRMPMRYLAIVSALILVLLLINFGVQWFRPYEFHGALLQSATEAQDFRLDTSTGKPMHLHDFRGKFLVLYFGYTFCPDVCPLTLNELAEMIKRLGPEAAGVQVILISLDPERDTVAQLATYLPYFHPSFLGMTGDIETILQVATQFGIFYEKRSDASGYTVDHTSTVVVVDPDGYPKLVFPFGTTGEQMASDLQYLLR